MRLAQQLGHRALGEPADYNDPVAGQQRAPGADVSGIVHIVGRDLLTMHVDHGAYAGQGGAQPGDPGAGLQLAHADGAHATGDQPREQGGQAQTYDEVGGQEQQAVQAATRRLRHHGAQQRHALGAVILSPVLLAPADHRQAVGIADSRGDHHDPATGAACQVGVHHRRAAAHGRKIVGDQRHTTHQGRAGLARWSGSSDRRANAKPWRAIASSTPDSLS